MMSLSFKNTQSHNNTFTITFNNSSNTQRLAIIKIILNSFSELPNLKFFITIIGVGGTIDNILDEIISDNFYYDDKNKYKFFPKELDKLYLITENESDINVFESYIGSFNEGSMTLSLINTNYALSSIIDKKEILDFINKNGIINIDVIDDGESLEIYSDNIEKLFLIYTEIGKFMFRKNTQNQQ